MTIGEFIVIIGGLWTVLGLVDIAQSKRRGPTVIQHVGRRIFSAFWPSALLHVGLFCLLYSAVAYVVIQMNAIDVVIGADPVNIVLVALLWFVGGVSIAASLTSIIRSKKDDTWLLRQWLERELRRSENPELRLEALLERIQSHPEEDSSEKALLVLREFSRRGDSIGGLAWNALEKRHLL